MLAIDRVGSIVAPAFGLQQNAPMKLRLFLVIAVPLLCLFPAQQAQGDTLGTGTIEVKIQLPDGNNGFRDPSDQEVVEFFNRAHCLCPSETFAAQFTLMNEQAGQNACIVEVWVGPGCPDAVDLVNREATCEDPIEYSDVRSLRTPTDLQLSVAAVASPNTRDCAPAENSASIYALIDDANENDNVWAHNTFLAEVSFDTLAPPEPHNPVAQRGEGAAVLSWEPPTSRQEDIQFYQVLCARADGTVNADDNFGDEDPEWETSNDLCGVEDSTIVVHLPTSTGTTPDADAGVSTVFGPGADAMVNDASVSDASVTPDAGVTPDAMVNDAGVVTGDLPDSLANLDPSTICGTASGTETGIRVTGLENGITYRIVLLAIDESKNVTALDLGEITPQPVTDFWEDYKDEGGTAEGGFCLANATFGGNHPFTQVMRDFRDDVLATTGLGQAAIGAYYNYVAPLGAHIEGSLILRLLVGAFLLPAVAIAAFWVFFGWFGFAMLFALVVWDRKRSASPTSRPPRRRTPRFRMAPALAAAAAMTALLVWSPQTASAQKYDPYWEHFEDKNTEVGIGKPKWVFELKFGPYVPQIDNEFSMEPGPYERTFGTDTQIMGIIELDRFFAWPLGQFGVATSIGYVTNTANTFELDSMGNQVRSEADETSFNLMPISVGAVYRYTQLDDKWRIPLVPYAKAGLSYYVWWITAPDGSTAEVPTSGCPTAPSNDCTGDEARGASLGFQLSLGLSIRAERFDKNSAASLRNELGIAHAGFFVEMTYAQVDGFGNDKKLSVGDLTWFGGLNFEF